MTNESKIMCEETHKPYKLPGKTNKNCNYIHTDYKHQ